MIETTKVCAMNGCAEGEDRSFGIVTFNKRKRNGDVYSVCDHCHDNAYRNARKRMKGSHYGIKHNNCVYAFIKDNEIVYIGSSRNTPHRMYQHLGTKRDTGAHVFNEMNLLQRSKDLSWVILWHGEDGDDDSRIHQEKLNIQLHQPKFNKILYKNYEG